MDISILIRRLFRRNGHVPGLNKGHLDEILDSFEEPKDRALVERAYNFAYPYLRNVKRDNDDSFLAHMVESCYILLTKVQPAYEAATGVKITAVDYAALMIHDVHEESDATLDDVEKEFGSEVRERIVKISTEDRGPDRYKYSFNKLIAAITNIPSIIALKLPDRDHNMLTLYAKDGEKQVEIATDTREHFVPLLWYLGLDDLAEEFTKLADDYIDVNDVKFKKTDAEIMDLLKSMRINERFESYAAPAMTAPEQAYP